MITKSNYNRVLEKVKAENQSLSESLLAMKAASIDGDIYFGSVGNSISAGYSKCDDIIPFFKRAALFDMADPSFKFLSYSRVRRNEDRLILKWYIENKTNVELTSLNIDDILAKKGKYAISKWHDGIIDEYRAMSNGQVIGLRDFNQQENAFIIYNGMTGVFTNILRKGNLYDKTRIFSSFEEDLRNFESFLKTVYLDNSGTQVYVCGLPNLMGTGIISLLDRNIKEICARNPNAIYVPGTIRNCLFFLEGQQEFDVHYSNPEYLILWNNILRTILKNYLSTKLQNALLNRFSKYSETVELANTTSKGSVIDIKKIIAEEIEKHIDLRLNQRDFSIAISQTMSYYNNNYLSLFPCTPREHVLRELESLNSESIDSRGHFTKRFILK